MADRPTRTPTDLERRLHKALRECALNIVSLPPRGSVTAKCTRCKQGWLHLDEPERHAPGCLAAPDALGDER